jgi:hypothetical protein
VAAVELTAPRTQVVVLGASNVARGLARLAATVRARSPAPIDLFVAAGHGRAYGVSSRVWARRLPSILASGLWRSLDRGQVEKPLALLTDVGNELLYGLGVAAVAGAVGEAARRLADRGARLAITGLPLESISGVGSVRYGLLRSLYVPGCPLALDALKEAARWVDDELRSLAATLDATYIEQRGEWYGFDAIHLKRPRLDDLWGSASDAWGLPAAPRRPRASLTEWARLGSRAAEVRGLGRAKFYTPQPTALLRGALRLWLY